MIPTTRFRVGFAVVAALACSAGTAQAPPAIVPRSLEVPEGTLLPAGKAADLELLATGDVIGYIETCGCKLTPAGGLSRRSWLVNKIRAEFPQVPIVLLDTGNFSDNPTAGGELRTRMLLETMVKLGTKVAGIGERELNLGYDDFLKRIQGVDMKFVSTNIVKDGTTVPVFPPYAVVEAAGRDGKPIRIGVLDVVRYNPTWQKAGPEGSNLAVAMPETMIAKFLPEVRAKSDVVVLMAALAKDDAAALASKLQGVDLMLVAYGGVYSTVEEKSGSVRMLYLGNQGKRVAENRVSLDGKRRVADVTTYMHFLTAHYPDDPEMKDAVAKVEAQIAPPESGTP
jgi:2',3'-cyclic-nucleotide 2'-phosphodiesterase (5'-nucleotidase family)